MTRWHENHDNLTAFLWWLFEECGFEAEALLEVIEKPWKWDDEYKLFRMSEQPGPWKAVCPDCGFEVEFGEAKQGDIDWSDGETSWVCGQAQGVSLGREDFCDTYLKIELSVEVTA